MYFKSDKLSICKIDENDWSSDSCTHFASYLFSNSFPFLLRRSYPLSNSSSPVVTVVFFFFPSSSSSSSGNGGWVTFTTSLVNSVASSSTSRGLTSLPVRFSSDKPETDPPLSRRRKDRVDSLLGRQPIRILDFPELGGGIGRLNAIFVFLGTIELYRAEIFLASIWGGIEGEKGVCRWSKLNRPRCFPTIQLLFFSSLLIDVAKSEFVENC